MNRMKNATAVLLTLMLPLMASCASYNSYQKARKAEGQKNWDVAITEYEKALDVDPENTRFRMSLQRSKLEASRVHFEKAKALLSGARNAPAGEQVRLYRMAASELELTVRLDTTNQYAAVELAKAVDYLEQARRSATPESVEDVKRRAKTSKIQPPQLNPASEDPISLNFPRETPVKDIYRALGNAFGINILFDQAVKDDRIVIELRDVTAQQALERVMQAANHFYKVLDEKTIIVVPDNPQARRDYEDLVIRTFYLSNGDAEQVTNVVRTMIEARNVFPLKALNAITIRDTADKVRIAEKIIEANDKAKAEVVVDVELLQLDLNRLRDLGMAIGGFASTGGTSASASLTPFVDVVGADGKVTRTPFSGGSVNEIANVLGRLSDLKDSVSVAIPTATYAFLKTAGDTELLANPELRISEGEKATLHIGQRIPVPVTTFQSANTQPNTGGTFAPVTSYQYQDVGIKVSMEPRVHHNREVTLKLSVEVSNQGGSVGGQPIFATRTIESTIRLKDGETNFLAGLIQSNKESESTKTPFLGDLPLIGRLFTRNHRGETRTDLILTMTPHIIRIPDITDDDVAPMWVGTTNNITFRGVSPRIESQAGIDPFVPPSGRDQFNPANLQLSSDGEPGNYVIPGDGRTPASSGQTQTTTPPTGTTPIPGGGPNDPFRNQQPPVPAPTPVPSTPQVKAYIPNTQILANLAPPPAGTGPTTVAVADDAGTAAAKVSSPASSPAGDDALLRLAPRISPQPASFVLNPGESKLWSVVGMDLDGLVTNELVFRFDPRSLYVMEVTFGVAMNLDPVHPPVATIDREKGYVKISSSDGQPLRFLSGGEVLTLRVNGGQPGETFLVIDRPELKDARGQLVQAAISGGRAKIN
jgi:general secretion pathway protein D